uniref:Beta-1,3-glucanase n=1 Tax=Cichorium intybus x Cichorium endivia TaxID=125629 RepID=O82673_9ASTR|nr:beta-1,3-glucanase [Cichorium intybus x Cichorium endivia]
MALHTPGQVAPLLLLLGMVVNFHIFIDAQAVGVCYGRVAVPGSLPSEEATVNLYQQNGITAMRIYDPNQATLQALQGIDIELMLDVPNSELESLNNPVAATTWVRNNIQNYPGVNFRYIAVGNEVDPNNNATSDYVKLVLPAMRNVHQAIVDASLANQIKVSTATYTGLLENSYPPSDGVFHENVKAFIEPIIAFLVQNNLPMLANIYPYFAAQGSMQVNLSYALLQPDAPVVNDNGIMYSNLFDAMLDAHYAAQAPFGGENLEIVVSESGWPSCCDSIATVENAGTYYRNLIGHVTQVGGTSAKPGKSIETYQFAMFDENIKDGDESEKHFGIFSPNQTPKYQVNF